MELENQEANEEDSQLHLQQNTSKVSFQKPFQRFHTFITRSLQINIFRFFVVTFIYYKSETFLSRTENTTGPWNSMIYFLAIMIEVIRFIGDFSLRNFLTSEKPKLAQIQEAVHAGKEYNVSLRAAPYETYLDIFSLVHVFKFTHKNYSSAFWISKYMHFLCTFLTFGWMSLKEQFGMATPLQAATLWIFIVSIFITTFEVDLYLLETSNGKNVLKNQQNYERPLSDNEREDIERNFTKWRNSNIVWQVSGMLFIIAGLIVHRKLNLLFCASLFMCLTNLQAFYLETVIKKQCSLAVRMLKRSQVNTYSVLNKSAEPIRIPFRVSIILQRLSIFVLWCAFVRDRTLPFEQVVLMGVGIALLIFAQKVKFNKGNSLKLMMIRQIYYNQESLESSPKGLECCICLKEIENREKVMILPCSAQHIFHEQCIKQWNKEKKECPLCRYQLSDYL